MARRHKPGFLFDSLDVKRTSHRSRRFLPGVPALKIFGDPTGIRTRVTAVKGRCLKPLDHGADISMKLVGPPGLEPGTNRL